MELIICRGKTADALNSILSEPPYGDGVDEAKVSVVMMSGGIPPCRRYQGLVKIVRDALYYWTAKPRAKLNEQNLTTNAVLLILNSTRATDIPNILKQLGDAQQDHLMA